MRLKAYSFSSDPHGDRHHIRHRSGAPRGGDIRACDGTLRDDVAVCSCSSQ